jgi:hypothetical protein
LAKVVSDGAGVLSRHWPAEERPYQRATISGGDFVQIVAVGVVKQFEQCPFREVLVRFVVHAPKRYADRITNRSTADHPVPPRFPLRRRQQQQPLGGLGLVAPGVAIGVVEHNKCYATCAQFADATFLREKVPRKAAEILLR